jgi:hypothetical protein
MTGHGAKFGRKKEEAIVALLTTRTIEEAARGPHLCQNAHAMAKGAGVRSCFSRGKKGRLQPGNCAAASAVECRGFDFGKSNA